MAVLVLVCAMASLADCSPASAIRLPGRHVLCPPMLGQGFIAETALGRDLAPGEAVKIVCGRS